MPKNSANGIRLTLPQPVSHAAFNAIICVATLDPGGITVSRPVGGEQEFFATHGHGPGKKYRINRVMHCSSPVCALFIIITGRNQIAAA